MKPPTTVFALPRPPGTVIEWIWQPGTALRFREVGGHMVLEQLFHGTAYMQDTLHEWRPVPTVTQAEAEQWRGPVIETTQTKA
jgi:hypothetical protein